MACVTEDDQLFNICQSGDLEAFKMLYNQNNSILDRKISGLEETPLHLASRFKHMVLVKEILKNGNHMAKARNGEEDTALHVACRQGERDIVEELLKACSFLPYILNKNKQSALYQACSCGHEDLASLLCQRMIFSGRDGISASCLRIASFKGYKDIVWKIIEENPSLATINGNLVAIKLLLTKLPIKVDNANNEGMTALDILEKNQPSEAEEERAEIIKQLKDRKRPDPISQTTMQETSLNNMEQGLMISLNNMEQALMASLNNMELALMTSLNNMEQGLMTSPNNMEQGLMTSPNDMQHAPPVSQAPRQETPPNNLQQTLTGSQGTMHEAPLNIQPQAPSQSEVTMHEASLGNAQPAQPVSQAPRQETSLNDCMRQALTVLQATMQETSLKNKQQALMVVAGLIVTLTFQAGLNPPGGLWQDSEQGNQTNHEPGKAIQSETNLWLFTVFLASDALGFISSLALIPLIMILQTNTLRCVNSLVVMALVSVEVAFLIGLIMISDRAPRGPKMRSSKEAETWAVLLALGKA
ncbi:hypothetical protein AAC387_Pa03g3807 [Persea americana]